jgi:hypothetical protein
MISLIVMNVGYLAVTEGYAVGTYPLSALLLPLVENGNPHFLHVLHETGWWAHILLIFLFANILPYSKHFHVFMSIPNVFLSRLEPLGHLPNMEAVMHEVRLMLNPDALVPVLEGEPGALALRMQKTSTGRTMRMH